MGLNLVKIKYKWIMYLGIPIILIEVIDIISMLYYYRDMWPRQYHILAPMTEAAAIPKGRKLL